MQNLKRNDTNEFMVATVMGGGGSRMRERILREFKINIYIAIFKMNNQQRPTVQHRELCSMLRGSPDERGV